MTIVMKNQKRKAAIAKIRTLKGGKEFIAAHTSHDSPAQGNELKTGELVAFLRKKGYIYLWNEFITWYKKPTKKGAKNAG